MADIRLENVSKSFEGKTVLSGLSLSFAEGETVCIMAPSGYGKTTLLRLILGLEKADGGSISGTDCRMCPVFQEDRLSPEHTPIENIRPVLSRHTPPTEIEKCLADLGLEVSCFAQPIAEFSGGMARRVAIARALLAEGKWLVLDEPFRGLDEETRARAAACILARRKGRGILLVCHDPAEAALLSARILRLDELQEKKS